MRNLTKNSRLDSRNRQFEKLIKDGFIQETYKELDFFKKNDGKYFTLKVFRGTAANHEEYINYRTENRRAEIIENYKNNYDRRQDYKAEEKIKNKGKMSSHAAAAAAIKLELSKLFPGIKFSAKSDSFSMGDSVHVSWTDGPTSDEVDNIISKYQYGSFNGMEDIYEYSNGREDIPQSKYVSGSRTLSDGIKILIVQLEDLLIDYKSEDWHNSTDQIFYRICRKTSFPLDYSDAKIIRTNCRAGQMEDFYQIIFNSPEANDKESNSKSIEEVKGEINIVDYSEKAFAIIGDFSKIYDDLINLGGSYNSRLKCGKGIVFSKKKMEAVTVFLSELSQKIEDSKKSLRDEVIKTVEFFAEHDIKMIGEISESTKEVARVQNIALTYDNLRDISEAAKSGKIISLCNLSQLVNKN